MNAMAADRWGKLWIAAADRLLYFDPLTGVCQHSDYNPDSLKLLEIELGGWNIFIDKSDVLWVSRFHGAQAYRYDFNQNILEDLVIKSIDGVTADHSKMRFMEDSRGNFWFGSLFNGLFKQDKQTGIITHFQHDKINPHSLSHNHVLSLLEDNSGKIWVGTKNNLNKFDPNQQQFGILGGEDLPFLNPGFWLASIWPVYEDIWLLTAQQGLCVLDRNFKLLTVISKSNQGDESWQGEHIWDVCPSTVSGLPAHVWFATSYGLYRFENASDRIPRVLDRKKLADDFNNVIVKIHQDSEGMLWLGTWGGPLIFYDPQADTLHRYGLETGNDTMAHNYKGVLFSIVEDSHYLWVGSSGTGLYQFNKKKRRFVKHFLRNRKDENALISNQIWAMMDDGDHLYIGTDAVSFY